MTDTNTLAIILLAAVVLVSALCIVVVTRGYQPHGPPNPPPKPPPRPGSRSSWPKVHLSGELDKDDLPPDYPPMEDCEGLGDVCSGDNDEGWEDR